MHPYESISSEHLTVNFTVHGDFSHIEMALQSLYTTTHIPFQVYMTINTGTVPQVEQIRAKYPQVNIKVNPQPVGFAANHNAIMRLAQTPFVALLNDDVTFHPGALDALVTYLQTHADVGLVGPVVENPDGTPQLSTFSDPSLLRVIYGMSGLARLTRHGGRIRGILQQVGITRYLGVESLNTALVTRDVPVIVGVCMVVRRAAYLQAGTMDEHTLVYGEEFGWHWRLRQKGWRVVFVPSARVTHYNREADLSGGKLIEARKGILAYFLLYRPAWQVIVVRLSIILCHTLAMMVTLPFDRKRANTHWQTVKIGATWNIPR